MPHCEKSSIRTGKNGLTDLLSREIIGPIVVYYCKDSSVLFSDRQRISKEKNLRKLCVTIRKVLSGNQLTGDMHREG